MCAKKITSGLEERIGKAIIGTFDNTQDVTVV